jgi:hypothetical protein
MRGSFALVLAIALGAVAVPVTDAGSAGATVYRVSATMGPRQVVTVTNKPWAVPSSYAKATGRFTGRFNPSTGALTWRVTFSDLAHSTLRIVDIHYGAVGEFGAFLARACAGCRSGQSGTVKVRLSARKAITAGQAWVTVITEQYPNGVIRGQIKAHRIR